MLERQLPEKHCGKDIPEYKSIGSPCILGGICSDMIEIKISLTGCYIYIYIY